jgi:hypothetical protein
MDAGDNIWRTWVSYKYEKVLITTQGYKQLTLLHSAATQLYVASVFWITERLPHQALQRAGFGE